MSMDQAAVWLSGSILVMLGLIVIVIGILIINNLFYKHWKSINWIKYNYHPVYYDPETGEQFLKEPTTDKKAKK